VRKRSRETIKRYRRSGLTWLAILAVLVDALVPTAVSAAAKADPLAAGRIYCGATPSQPNPVKQSPAVPHHCVFCLAAAIGLLPGYAPAVPAPPLTEIAVAAFAISEAAPKPLANSAAQPRGPPVGA